MTTATGLLSSALGTTASLSGFTGQFTLFSTQAANIRSFGKASNFVKGQSSLLYFGVGGAFAAPAVVREHNVDQYQITEHPVINGTNITDHAYALPRRVDIEIIYSVSTGSTNGLKAITSAAANALDVVSLPFGLTIPTSPVSIKDYYEAFRTLQRSLVPFDITTGKLKYTNMLIESIEENTSEKTENLLKLYIRCKEVKISYTQYIQAQIKEGNVTIGPLQQVATDPTPTAGTNISQSGGSSSTTITPPSIPGVPVQ